MTRDMKYWMNVRWRRKFQFISNRPNLLKNLIWAIKLWIQILIPFEFQGGLLIRLQMKKDQIIDLKSALRMVLIVFLFHLVSFHLKIVLQNVNNLILVSKNRVKFLKWWTVGVVWKDHYWFLTIKCFIWSNFICSMVRSIVPSFSEREPLLPLMSLFRGETMNISFQEFVDNSSMTIYLWVISRTDI